MENKIVKKTNFFKENIFFIIFILISCGLAIYFCQPIKKIYSFVDWNTIILLSGLIIITTAIKESGFFYFLAYNISKQIKTERMLALFLIFISTLLSMFLTNDIALFIIVPLTLALQDISSNDYTKLIVFEAIAVNVGSSLTPIGNPQNIFLWNRWHISFFTFIKELYPLVLVLCILLLIFAFFSFPSRKITSNDIQQPVIKRTLYIFSTIFLILFILAIELRFEKYLFIVIFLFYSLIYTEIILNTNWKLILMIIFIFIDIGLLGEIGQIKSLMNYLDLNNSSSLFLCGIILSQIISNVPATILLTKYSNNFKIIAFGVNVGGNGLILASFANLIALNFSKNKSKYIIFHVYSIPFLVISSSILFLFLKFHVNLHF